jgi:alpha-L-fucosidase
VLDSPVPYVAGDQVTVVGGNMSGSVVPSRLLSNGSLELTISDAVAAADQYSWVFKIAFGGVSANGTATGSAPPVQQTTNGSGKWSPDLIMLMPSVVLGIALWLM